MSRRVPTSSREVFDDHAQFVWRALRYLGVRDADLPDVSQEVFITVHRKLETFEGRAAFTTWLYRICQRAASDHRRKAHVRREIVSDEPKPAVSNDVDGVSAAEARAVLAHALDQLDDDKREVFVLYEIEGLAMKEVAAVVDCPLQTAYSRLHAARRIVVEAVRGEELGGAS